MHNWRLLLLALIAVLQPIASFTERNLIDGRQECCDPQPQSLLRDSRLPLHGTYRFSKTIPEERRLSHREEIREDRRYESGRQNLISSRPSRERLLLEKNARRISPEQAIRSVRAERIRYGNRVRVILQTRERRARDIRLIRRDVSSRIVDERSTRDSLVRRHDRDTIKSTQSKTSTGDRRAHLSTKLSTKQMENSGQFQAHTRTRIMDLLEQARNVITQSKKDNHRNIRDESSERYLKRRESTFRLETRPQQEDYRERRSLERRTREILSDYRRALSADTRMNDQVRSVRQEMRRNSRQEPEDRPSSRQRLVMERLDERRQQRDYRASRDRTDSVRRGSRERTSTDRRFDTRDSARMLEINVRSGITARNLVTNRNERYSVYREDGESVRVESRRNAGREFDSNRGTVLVVRVESRKNMERKINNNRDTVMARRARGVIRVNNRDTRDVWFSRSAEDISARDVSRTRVGSGAIRDNNVKREAIDSRYRNTELARNRENIDFMIQKKTDSMSEDQTFIMNWQFVFYTLQGIYLCSLLVQMLSEKESAKRKTRNLTSWPLFSWNLVKMD